MTLPYTGKREAEARFIKLPYNPVTRTRFRGKERDTVLVLDGSCGLLVSCWIGLRLCLAWERGAGGRNVLAPPGPGFGLGCAFRWIANGIREMATSVRIALRWHSQLGLLAVWLLTGWMAMADCGGDDDLREWPCMQSWHFLPFPPPQANLPIICCDSNVHTNSVSEARTRQIASKSVLV
ncbi:hypothetical protein BGY98DRAFT_91777 [Russula aff. rugulosa BPL654]|nr:hypothetical protein BGY98DRAFT_91777 [Russula aff. rugulosa BPL654]